jgi:hypothetical protein
VPATLVEVEQPQPVPPPSVAPATAARSTAVASGIVTLLFGAYMLACAADVASFALVPAVVVGAGALLLSQSILGATQAGPDAALASGLLTLVPLAAIPGALAHSADLRLVTALLSLGAIPFVAASTPAMIGQRLHDGGREDITPALLASALAGGFGVLVILGVARFVSIGDDRLGPLLPYWAAGMALLGVAVVLAHHRVGAGFPFTVAAIAGGGIGVEILLLLSTTPSPDATVTAVTVSSGVVAAGLLVATAVATPRPLVIPRSEAADGPRFAPWIVGATLIVAVAVRVWSLRPLWVDEADTVRVTDGSFHATLEAAGTGGKDAAFPPLGGCVERSIRSRSGRSRWRTCRSTPRPRDASPRRSRARS